ncbi:MAG: hypothetical protein U0V70_16065 [Terriglobia bacterium]
MKILEPGGMWRAGVWGSTILTKPVESPITLDLVCLATSVRLMIHEAKLKHRFQRGL